MIEEAVTVLYGDTSTKMKDLQREELMLHTVPEQGDELIINETAYSVQRKIFDTDTGGLSIIAVKGEKKSISNVMKKQMRKANQSRRRKTKGI